MRKRLQTSATPLEEGKGPAKRHVWCVASRRQTPMVADMENITPAKRALATLDNPPPAEDIGKHRRVSKKVSGAIDKLVSGECKTLVAEPDGKLNAASCKHQGSDLRTH